MLERLEEKKHFSSMLILEYFGAANGFLYYIL
jgi:hypothetical protein